MCEIRSKLTIKTPERCHWHYFTLCSSVSIVNFEQVNASWPWAHDLWLHIVGNNEPKTAQQAKEGA